MRTTLLLALLAAIPAAAQMDIEYQPAPLTQRLDVFTPEGSGPFPAVVVLHGGRFLGGSRKDTAALCQRLVREGFVAVAVDYRLPPQQLFPAPLNDVKSSIRWLRANAARYHVDPSRIGAIGTDAGGYLALFAALTGGMPEFEGIGPNLGESSRIACAAAVRPMIDPRGAPDAMTAFLGGDPAHAAARYRRANLLHWITPAAAPVIVLDSSAEAKTLSAKLRESGAESEIAEGEDAAIAFLRRRLAVAPQTRIMVSDHGPGGEVLLLEWPSGNVLWRAPNEHGHDVQMVANGNVLFTIDNQASVVEMDPRHEVVWKYGPAEGLKLTISAQRLADGNTLIADTKVGTVREVTRAGKIVWEYTSDDLANNRMRHCTRTAAGSTLIAIEAAGKIIEVDRAGKIVWSWTAPGGSTRRPYQAMRLPAGNTLITLMTPGELVEVDPAGKIVRSIGGTSDALRIGWASGFDLLPDGHILLGDYTGQRLIEVDAAGMPVHDLPVPYRPATVSVVRQ